MNDIYSRTHASQLEDTYFHEETLRRIAELRQLIAQRAPQASDLNATPALKLLAKLAA